jgi:drug/metabolite transporter (DMT)-like permease
MKDQDNDPIVASVLLQIISGIIIALAGLFQGLLNMDQDYQSVAVNIILMVLLYSSGGITMFLAFQRMNPSRFAIIFASRAVFTLIFSSLLLQESLTGNNFLGLILILVSIIMLNYVKGTWKFSKGDIFAFYTAFAFGTSNTNDRFLLATIDTYPYMVIGFLLPALVNLLIFRKRFLPLKSFVNQHYLTKMLVLCVIYAGSAIFFFLALQKTDNSSQLASLNLLNGVITVMLSIWIFKEKDRLGVKILAAGISLVGLMLIA